MIKKYRKITVIVLFAIALAVAGYFASRYFSGQEGVVTPAPATNTVNATGSLPTAAAAETEQVLQKISDQPVFDFFAASTSTEEIIYITPAGIVFQVTAGEDSQLSKQTFSALNSIAASPSRRKILAAFGDPTAPQWLIFDLAEKAWRPLASAIRQAVWGNSDSEVFAVSGNNLVKINPEQNLAAEQVVWRNFSLQDVEIVFAPPQKIIFSEKPFFAHQGRAWELDLRSLELNLVFGPASGFYLRQTADRSLILKFDSREYLTIVTPTQTLSYETFPEKCGFNGGQIQCFVPTFLPVGGNWPDDYLQKSFFSEDQLFETSENGSSIVSLPAGVKIDGWNPVLAGNSLYFLNRRDNSLYQLRLFNEIRKTVIPY